LSGSAVTCPHCGKETTLYVSVPPSAPKIGKFLPDTLPPQQFTKPARSKISTGVWIGTGVVVLCAVCIASILIGKNLQKRSEPTSQAINENGDSTTKPSKTKPGYPPPPTSGMEFMAKILKNFPERVDKQHGWMDATFWKIDNSPVKEIMGYDYAGTEFVAFTVSDKNGDWFGNCVGAKSKLGDQLIQLQDGDRIRIFGEAANMQKSDTGSFDVFLRVDSIQVIK